MKKVISLLLSLMMLLSIASGLDFSAYASIITGGCGVSDIYEPGNTVSYNFDTETGILNIIGSGNMAAYETGDKRTNIFGGAFDGTVCNRTESVTKIIIGNKVTSIGNGAFQTVNTTGSNGHAGAKFSNLQEVTIGSSVVVIGNSAFYQAPKLVSVSVPSSCTKISSSAFYNCVLLETVALGTSVSTLDNFAFAYDYKLQTPYFPVSLTTIGNFCFKSCSSMTGNAVLYSKTVKIGRDAFDGTNLDSISIYNKDCDIYKSATTIPMHTKIIGHIGSTAQEYADEFGNEFEPIAGETTEIVAPTCTERGYTVHRCNDCGAEFIDNYTDSLGHNEVPISAQAPTCTETGHSNGYICSICGAVINGVEKIPANGHIEKVSKDGKEPTCTETGLTEEKTCDVCGVVLQTQTVIPANGHNYELISEVTPNCTETGEKKYKCTVCNDIKTETVPAKGHSYAKTVVEPTCLTRGFTYNECTVCGNNFKSDYTDISANHTYESKVTIAPTCTTTGLRTYTCSICGDSYTESVETIAHTPETDDAVAADCEKPGLTQGSHCSVCGKVLTEQTVVNAKGHNYKAVITAPTCKDKGYTTYTCTVCGDSYKSDYTEITDNHKYIGTVTTPATCTKTGVKTYTCSVCGDTYTETIDKIAHTPETDNSAAATCEKPGLTEGSHCSVCGAVITRQEVVNATGHNYESAVTAPTCTGQGYTTYTCTVCGDSYKDNYTAVTGEHSYTSAVTTPATCTKSGVRTYTCSVCGDKYTETIPMANHTAITDAAVAATCTKSGLTEGSHCSVCGAVITAQQVVNAKGHNYSKTVVAPTCRDRGYTVNTCTVCGDTYRDNYTPVNDSHEYKASVTTPATCSRTGVRTYTCTICGDKYTETIPTIAHTIVTDVAVAPTCEKAGLTEGSHCSACGAVIQAQQVVKATGHQYEATVIAPNCRDKGYTIYKCTDCGDAYRADYTDRTSEHDYVSVTSKQPTCSVKGVKTTTCSICGNTFTEEIPTLAHTEEIDKAVAPTCTKAGLTEGKHCSVCGTVTVPQKTVAATGHSEVIDNAVPATCTESGLTEGKHCSVCGTVIKAQEIVNALGHNWDDGTVTTEATTSAEGVKTYTCTVCGETKTESIPKLVAKNGWVLENNKWYYYTNNVAAKGWKQVNGKWYYFNNAGVMLTDWQYINGKWYYMNSSGAMVTGWQKLSGTWYYFNTGGDMVTGWKYIGGSWYYFNSSGSMRTASLTQGGKTYYFNSSGACTNP